MNRPAKAIRVLMPNCRQAIRLQSEALDRPLSRLEKIGLRLHLAFCTLCRRYGQQIQFLRTAARRSEPAPDSQPVLPVEARERIKHALAAGHNPPP